MQDAAADLRERLGRRRFSTILADPPWQFANRTGKIAPEHVRLSRYGTMGLDEISKLPVSEFVKPKAHLYLWCPNALLPEGLKVMKDWRLFYRMGYDDLNKSHDFTIQYRASDGSLHEKQVDVFCKDNETVVIGECKCCDEYKSRSLSKDLVRRPSRMRFGPTTGENLSRKFFGSTSPTKFFGASLTKARRSPRTFIS